MSGSISKSFIRGTAFLKATFFATCGKLSTNTELNSSSLKKICGVLVSIPVKFASSLFHLPFLPSSSLTSPPLPLLIAMIGQATTTSNGTLRRAICTARAIFFIRHDHHDHPESDLASVVYEWRTVNPARATVAFAVIGRGSQPSDACSDDFRLLERGVQVVPHALAADSVEEW